MFSPVESQVIFLSKETPIVSVGLRTAEVSYTNKTAWKSEVVQALGWPLPICVQTFTCVNESFWLAKYFHPFKLRKNFLPFTNLYPLKYVFERNSFCILDKRHRHENWESSNGLFDWVKQINLTRRLKKMEASEFAPL